MDREGGNPFGSPGIRPGGTAGRDFEPPHGRGNRHRPRAGTQRGGLRRALGQGFEGAAAGNFSRRRRSGKDPRLHHRKSRATRPYPGARPDTRRTNDGAVHAKNFAGRCGHRRAEENLSGRPVRREERRQGAGRPVGRREEILVCRQRSRRRQAQPLDAGSAGRDCDGAGEYAHPARRVRRRLADPRDAVGRRPSRARRQAAPRRRRRGSARRSRRVLRVLRRRAPGRVREEQPHGRGGPLESQRATR